MDLHEEEDFLGSRPLDLCELDLGPGVYPGQRKLQIVDLRKSDPRHYILWKQRATNHNRFIEQVAANHESGVGCICALPSYGRRCNCGLHVPGIFGIP